MKMEYQLIPGQSNREITLVTKDGTDESAILELLWEVLENNGGVLSLSSLGTDPNLTEKRLTFQVTGAWKRVKKAWVEGVDMDGKPVREWVDMDGKPVREGLEVPE